MHIPLSQIIIGSHSIREILRAAPEKVLQIFTVSGKSSDVLELAVDHKVPIQTVSKKELDRLAQTPHHQNLLAHIQPRHIYTLKEFLSAKQPPMLLLLDQIFDPQNFGAILRTAECLGVSAVLWSKNRGTDLTPAAAKASSGASELIDLIRVSNLATSTDILKKEGYEVIAAQKSESAQNAYTFNFSPKTALIMGSEGEGIQPLLQKKVDRSIYIPMKGNLSSLNVAQATASLLTLWNARPGE